MIIPVSSLRETDTINQFTGEQKEPEVNKFKNSTKAGIDTADQMCSTFSVSRNGLKQLKRKIFLRTLSHQLVIGQLAKRSLNTSGLLTQLQFHLKRFLSQKECRNSHSPYSESHKCGMCVAESGFRRITNCECKNCGEPICISHVNPLCHICYSTACSEDSS
ncbi:hypothetical protein TNCT_550651 [Trichonephila clavata]|uniref:Uncharacterized protein n=1 Tax=Trichonephila clavata TaxID=2740835 RepID=A0A8X6FUL7_TRICU|nr:hypothetical protein TNCT_550651 [Trichonephila clavata]